MYDAFLEFLQILFSVLSFFQDKIHKKLDSFENTLQIIHNYYFLLLVAQVVLVSQLPSMHEVIFRIPSYFNVFLQIKLNDTAWKFYVTVRPF